MNDSGIDWYPKTLEGERALFGNIDSKIDGYGAKYPVLDAPFLQQIHTICQAFVEGYDKVTENRATARQMTSWFDSVVRSKQENQTVPATPVFQAITMRSGRRRIKAPKRLSISRRPTRNPACLKNSNSARFI